MTLATIGLDIGKAVLATLLREMGIEAVLSAIFETHGDAAREAILRAQYITTDQIIEAEKTAKFGPRPPG